MGHSVGKVQGAPERALEAELRAHSKLSTTDLAGVIRIGIRASRGVSVPKLHSPHPGPSLPLSSLSGAPRPEKKSEKNREKRVVFLTESSVNKNFTPTTPLAC